MFLIPFVTTKPSLVDAAAFNTTLSEPNSALGAPIIRTVEA